MQNHNAKKIIFTFLLDHSVVFRLVTSFLASLFTCTYLVIVLHTFQRCLCIEQVCHFSLAVCGAVSKYCLVNFLVNFLVNILLYLKLCVHFVVIGLAGYLLVVILMFSVWSEQLPCQSALINMWQSSYFQHTGRYSDWERLAWKSFCCDQSWIQSCCDLFQK